MRRYFAVFFMTVLSVMCIVAQNPVDSAKIYFRIEHRHFDPTLNDNRVSMNRFVEQVKKAAGADDIHHIVVRTYASPDGSYKANERLTRNRCESITTHIVNATGIDATLVKAYPEGVAWDELRRLVAITPGVPYREAVLEVIDNTPIFIYDENNSIVDGRKNRLMMVGGGKAYNWLFDNIFPRLRNAVAVSLFLKSDVRAARDAAAGAARAAANAADAAACAARAASDAAQASSSATQGIADAIREAEEAAVKAAKAADDAKSAANQATAAAAEASVAADAASMADEVSGARAKAAEAEAARAVAESAQAAAEASQSAAEAARAAAEAIVARAGKSVGNSTTDSPDSEVQSNRMATNADSETVNYNTVHNRATEKEMNEIPPLHRFALKTNMLYYAALMPNLELEWRVNDLWSVAIEGNVAWWKNSSRHKYYQVGMISPEARYHVLRRGPWYGLYVGAFAGATWYDLENGKTGYYGEGGFGGVSCGYMWPISRTLSLETSLGLGYLYTRYKEYVPFDDHYLYQRTKSTQYVGPLKLKFSLVWRFNDVNKKKISTL